MISYLKGRVLSLAPDSFILEVGGVGYKVFVSHALLSSLKEGRELEVFCHLHMRREETMELYGVSSPDALTVFESLLGVSGIGPKAALAISSLGSAQDLQKAITEGDERFFAGIHGVGRKKIQKIILELTGRLSNSRTRAAAEKKDEALQALVSLGFTSKDAREALSQISESVQDPQKRVQEALKLLGR